MSLTMGQQLAARRIKAASPMETCRGIAMKIRATEGEVRKFFDPDQRPQTRPETRQRKPQMAHSMRKTASSADTAPFGMQAAGIVSESFEKAPVDVLADRERRLAAIPETLGQSLLGDPMPGRSALDKRRGA